MKLLVIFMPFKNFMSSKELNNSLNYLNDLKHVKTTKIPFSDGGGSLLEIFNDKNTLIKKIKILDCFNRKNFCQILINKKKKFGLFELKDTMGQIKGIDKDPLKRSSYGVGQVIIKLSEYNLKKIYIGTGGSINTDCGIGMAHALGLKFYDKKNNLLNKSQTFFHARYLDEIKKIDNFNLKKKLKKIQFCLISDSSVRLCGKNGQINVFSKQKKIIKKDQKNLSKSFEKMKKIFELNSNKNFNIPYLGSGGGVSSMIYFIFKSNLIDGAKFIFKKQQLSYQIKKNDIIISGEGIIDKTTFKGKGLSKIIAASKKYKKKLYLITGKSRLKKIKYGNVIDLNYKKIPSKVNFIETLKKKVNSIVIANEKKN
ncbi:glycerate kinase [Candidatus Pelagibacter sp.]|jgi:glycerate 2-kinase|nr:glycerate kinase [Candidatus Pelagibacter sp.]